MAVNPIQIEKFLKGVNYPATKEQLINIAKQHGADPNVLETLENLGDKTFEKPTDIAKAIGQME